MAKQVNKTLVFAIIASALGSGFQHGYHSGVVNIPEKVLRAWIASSMKKRTGQDYSKSMVTLVWSITTSFINLGGIIGGLLTAVVGGKFGPKGGLIFNNIILLVACALMSLSKLVGSVEMLIIGRFVIGINCGLNAGLCPTYLSEISPVALRGAIGSVYQLVITISILISQVVSLRFLFGTETLWPILFALPVVFGVFQVITLPFCAESPKYLIGKKGDYNGALKALKWLRGSEAVDEEMAEIKSENDNVIAMGKVTLKDMFKKKSLRTPLFIALFLMMAQQLSGVNAVFFYSTGTFEQSGLKGDNPQYATLGVGTINVLMTVVSVFLVEIAGRKTLLLVGFGGMAIETLLQTFAQYFSNKVAALPYVCIALTFIYVILFASGAGSIPWFLVTEVFRHNARGTAVSMAVPTNWIFNLLVTLTFPSIEGAIGPLVFLIFVVLNAVFFVVIIKFVPETKNKSIDEITAKFE